MKRHSSRSSENYSIGLLHLNQVRLTINTFLPVAYRILTRAGPKEKDSRRITFCNLFSALLDHFKVCRVFFCPQIQNSFSCVAELSDTLHVLPIPTPTRYPEGLRRGW